LKRKQISEIWLKKGQSGNHASALHTFKVSFFLRKMLGTRYGSVLTLFL